MINSNYMGQEWKKMNAKTHPLPQGLSDAMPNQSGDGKKKDLSRHTEHQGDKEGSNDFPWKGLQGLQITPIPVEQFALFESQPVVSEMTTQRIFV